MSNLENFREERLKKIEILKAAGIDPYPKESFRDTENKKFLETYEEIESSKKEVTLAGRIMSVRNQGGIVFADLFDGTARVQTILKKDDIGDKFDLFMSAVDS